MKIYSLSLNNFRSFSELNEIKFEDLSTIIGQNDVGKSNILLALQYFLEPKIKMKYDDIHRNGEQLNDISITVKFSNLPEKIELEEGVTTTFYEESLLGDDEHLIIKKVYPKNDPSKFETYIIINDFEGDEFNGLILKSETQLNRICQNNEIDYSQSGRGITNRDKRKKIRGYAINKGISKITTELKLDSKITLYKTLISIMPRFVLFESDTKLGVEETSFQNQFNPIIQAATESNTVTDIKSQFVEAIDSALQNEIKKIFIYFQQHTDTISELKPSLTYSWEKAISFDIIGKDKQGVESSLDKRGSGIRRLLMVAFFQYLTEKNFSGQGGYIFAIEEPENCLHPGLQRELINSLKKLTEGGSQIIITSHSPIFVGQSPVDGLSLIKREKGIAIAEQIIDYSTADDFIYNIAEDLGVEPSDQITGYNACIFVEGPNDIDFLKWSALNLKKKSHIDFDFDDKNIGFIIMGGDNIKHWVNRRAMHRLNKRFGVMIDGDRKSKEQHIQQRKLDWKKNCEECGGLFYILRKRDIENYIHKNAISRSGRSYKDYDDFSDMKELFGDNVYKCFKDMPCEELLEMDKYIESGVEKHEIRDIITSLLSLSSI